MSNLVRVPGVCYGVKIDTNSGKELLDKLLKNPNRLYMSTVSRNNVNYSLKYKPDERRVVLYSDGSPQKAFNFDNLAKYTWN